MQHVTSIKFIKAIAENPDAPELFVGEHTHDPMLKVIVALSSFVQDPVMMTEIIAGYLPEDYSGTNLQDVPRTLEWALKNNAPTPEKRSSLLDKIIENFEANNIELFKNQDERGCLKIPVPDGGHDVFTLNSRRGKRKVRGILFREFGVTPRGNDFADLINTLESIAIFDGEQHEFRLRVAWEGENVAVDIGDKKRSVVICSKTGWEVGFLTSTMFVRREGYRPLPIPTKNGDLNALRDLLGIQDDHVWHCIIAFIINVLRPEGPYICMMIDGEQGSGKSVLSTIIKRITDPNQVEKLRFPRSDRDLMIQASKFFLISFDNASGVKRSLSDTLCSIATGGGFATRQLHTDDGLVIFNVCRPFIINGIGGFAYYPDLLERGVHVSLSARDPEKQKTEGELNEVFEALLPGVLGVFMDAIVCALKNFDTTETPKGIRMSDAAKWVAAAEPALGLPHGTLVGALRRSQNETMAAVAIETALAQGIIKVLHRNDDEFEGGYGELLKELGDVNANKQGDPFFPKTASLLSKRMRELKPALKKAGIVITDLPRTNTGSRIKIEFDDKADFSDDELSNVDF